MIFLILSSIFVAQSSAKIHYTKTIWNYGVPLATEAELLFDGENTWFVSNRGAYPGKYINHEGKQSEIYLDEKGDQVLKLTKERKIYLRRNSISTAYIAKEAIPKFKWTLVYDIKET